MVRLRLLFAAALGLAAALDAQGAPARRPGATSAPDPRVTRADLSRISGSANAKVWMLMISDFECPYCKEFHDQTAPALHKEFVATGKVRFAYLHYPLVRSHPNALPAAEASLCAGAQDRFWPYHDRLFRDAATWRPMRDPQPHFVEIARGLTLDLAAFRQCLADDVMLPLVQLDMERAAKAGTKSTPTFLVGSQLIPGNAPLDVMRRAITGALAASK